MAGALFRALLPEDLEHAVHELLPITEALVLQRVTHMWLSRLCDANVSV